MDVRKLYVRKLFVFAISLVIPFQSLHGACKIHIRNKLISANTVSQDCDTSITIFLMLPMCTESLRHMKVHTHAQ